jgi:hypothetical protein
MLNACDSFFAGLLEPEEFHKLGSHAGRLRDKHAALSSSRMHGTVDPLMPIAGRAYAQVTLPRNPFEIARASTRRLMAHRHDQQPTRGTPMTGDCHFDRVNGCGRLPVGDAGQRRYLLRIALRRLDPEVVVPAEPSLMPCSVVHDERDKHQ